MVFPFRYTKEGVVKGTPKVGASRGVWGHAPQKIVSFVASEMPYCPCFPRGSFINQSIKTPTIHRNSAVYLLSFGTTDISQQLSCEIAWNIA